VGSATQIGLWGFKSQSGLQLEMNTGLDEYGTVIFTS